ncbi:metallophosphoesterase family protein [Cognatishimia activa]|uniref:Serine/threonine protein phosphatase n=1 Tax=Cognatishimia activa TaxID=1715691 RepID=A0A975I8H1_9RHOB|nr:metallophosphoesterase family protein [Cognatishimia activa]QTN37258.1 serine/threonine protein phosphatase [Cognatishimia activa]
MPAIYAIGDIHGHFAQLETALARIEEDGGPDAQIVFLGDYIDRGPDSRAVIDLLSLGLAEGRNWVCLKGNHDGYLIDFLEHGRAESLLRPDLHWFDKPLGGAATLKSYGVDVEGKLISEVVEEARAAIPETHKAFMAALPCSHETETHFFAHAGIRPGVAFSDQVELDLTWIRGEFLNDTRDHGKLVVHGHTAVSFPEHAGNRVNLDGGTGFGRPLYPGVCEGGQVWVLTETGRQALEPQKTLTQL